MIRPALLVVALAVAAPCSAQSFGVTVTGKIQSLTLREGNPRQTCGPEKLYLEVVVSGNDSTVTFSLQRNIIESIDQTPSGEDYYAVPLSAVFMAMVTTLREAASAGREVTMSGGQVIEMNCPGIPRWVRLQSVTAHYE